MKSKILVFVQFLMIFLMLVPFMESHAYPLLGSGFLFLGLLVGFLAIKQQPKNNFNIRPDLKENCTLVTDGIYAYIRHPMYFSVLVGMFGVLLLKFNLLELGFYIILLINMLIKMLYEEKLWHCETQEYKKYSQTTARLIPKIF